MFGLTTMSISTDQIKGLGDAPPRIAPPDVSTHTGEYKSLGYQPWGYEPRDLPPFTFQTIRMMMFEPAIRLGLAMRAGPICNAEFAYQQGEKWIPGIQAESEELATFIWQTLQRIWMHDLPTILSSQVWGWAAGEVVYRIANGRIEFDKILHRNAQDVRALTDKGQLAGVRFLRTTNVADGFSQTDLRFPKSFFHAFRPEAGEHYGRSVLYGPYSPWADKWFTGGAIDVRRIFMHKDAYGGMRIGYPSGSTSVPTKGEIPNSDIARQMVEQIKAGAVVTFPSGTDSAGNPKWIIEDAKVASNPQHILQYPKDLDVEIFRGMEIPDEMVASDGGGAWAGKRVPAQAFYSGLDMWLNSIVRDITTQILEPLVWWNWGQKLEFEVRCKPLSEQAMEQQGTSPNPGQQPGQQNNQNGMGADGEDFGGDDPGQVNLPPRGQRDQRDQQQRLSLTTESIGAGVLNAAELVKAARRVLRGRATRLGPNGPQPGDRKTENGSTYQFNENHRWELVEEKNGAKQQAKPDLDHGVWNKAIQGWDGWANAKKIQKAGKKLTPNWQRMLDEHEALIESRIKQAGPAAQAIWAKAQKTGKISTKDKRALSAAVARSSEKSDKRSTGFASPNTAEGLTFEQAKANLGGEHHRKMAATFQGIDKGLGIPARQVSIIGDWGDGAEDSILCEYSSYQDYAELQYAMAWKGKLADQKAVLLFEENNEGKGGVYLLHPDDTVKNVREKLTDCGIAFRSIAVLNNGKPIVYVADLDGSLSHKIKKIGDHYGVEVEAIRGKGEFIGVESERDRADAHREYDRIIADYEKTFPDRRHYKPSHQKLAQLARRDTPRHAAYRPVVIGIGRRSKERGNA